MDGAGEGLALGEHGETVAQVRYVVLRLQFVSVERFVTLGTPTMLVTLETRAYLLLTSSGWAGSYLETEKAVVLVSTTSSILWKIVGLLRVAVGAAKVAF